MNRQYFIGIDISKATIDASLCEAGRPDHFTHDQFANTTAGFKKLLSWLVKQGADAGNSLVGMEHTGHYTLALCCFFQESSILYTLISPLHLKRSLGMARGKTGCPEARPRRRGPHRLVHLPAPARSDARSTALGLSLEAQEPDGLPRSAGQDQHQPQEHADRFAGDL